MPDRFYYPESLDVPEAWLEGTEAHHLLHVLRGREGDVVELFDGRGSAAGATIVETQRNAVRLRIDVVRRDPLRRGPAVTVAAPLPKSDRGRTLVEKLTELGVARYVPLRTSRSVIEPGSGKFDKLQQTAIAACKQSGRNTLLEVDATRDWSEFVAAECVGRLAIVADPTGVPVRDVLREALDARAEIVLAVGPEGGFDAAELRLATAAGARLVSLGETILRIETAAIALAAAVRFA